MQLREGSELQNGKYRIIRVLGQGGFGITYLAENSLLDRKVAIKEFFPKDFCGRDNTSHLTLGTQNNAETVARLKDRFLKEAKNIAKLDHPGIIKIHDIFEENNTAYYVMDYIEGENLNEMVKRQGPLSEAKAVEYIRKVGDALDYIHSRNMTHFDVKPANIMVRSNDDQPILIDFGLSKQYDVHGDATSTLMQGVSHGYSPIELYNPGSISSFSPQTDVYSLGATLYYLLTGNVPPSASDILENGITIPTTIFDANATVIRNAMAVSRSKRPQSISSFVDSLCVNNIENSQVLEKSETVSEETQYIPNEVHNKSFYDKYSDNNRESLLNTPLVFGKEEFVCKKDGSISSRGVPGTEGSDIVYMITVFFISFGIPLSIVGYICYKIDVSEITGFLLLIIGAICGFIINHYIQKNKVRKMWDEVDDWAISNPDDPRVSYIDLIKDSIKSRNIDF